MPGMGGMGGMGGMPGMGGFDFGGGAEGDSDDEEGAPKLDDLEGEENVEQHTQAKEDASKEAQ